MRTVKWFAFSLLMNGTRVTSPFHKMNSTFDFLDCMVGQNQAMSSRCPPYNYLKCHYKMARNVVVGEGYFLPNLSRLWMASCNRLRPFKCIEARRGKRQQA